MTSRRTTVDFFFDMWMIFFASTFGARWVHQGGDQDRAAGTGDYNYAGPTFFLVLGIVLQIPLLLRLLLYSATGG